jgi:hypothetical protein
MKFGGFLETPVPSDVLKITDFVRNIPLFLSDLSSDLRFKIRENNKEESNRSTNPILPPFKK